MTTHAIYITHNPKYPKESQFGAFRSTIDSAVIRSSTIQTKISSIRVINWRCVISMCVRACIAVRIVITCFCSFISSLISLDFQEISPKHFSISYVYLILGCVWSSCIDYRRRWRRWSALGTKFWQP